MRRALEMYDLTRLVLLGVLHQVGSINTPTGADPGDWPEGDLPDQGGNRRDTLPVAIYTFTLPSNLAQLWHDVEIEDTRPFLSSGQPNPSKGQKVRRKQLKFDRNAPLVVQGGTFDGQPMTATFTNNPRPRGGKKDDPKTAWISDLAYFLELGMADHSRPRTPEALVSTINKYAGKSIRLSIGRTAQCRPDKVRYIEVTTAEGAVVMADPSGQKGCGSRYYTRDFKDPTSGKYDDEVVCSKCGAVLRGFEQVEQILTPLGQ